MSWAVAASLCDDFKVYIGKRMDRQYGVWRDFLWDYQ